MSKKQIVQSCSSCALWGRAQALDEAGRLQKKWGAHCLWKSTEPWPISVDPFDRRPTVNYTLATWGKNCPCWKPRETD